MCQYRDLVMWVFLLMWPSFELAYSGPIVGLRWCAYCRHVWSCDGAPVGPAGQVGVAEAGPGFPVPADQSIRPESERERESGRLQRVHCPPLPTRPLHAANIISCWLLIQLIQAVFLKQPLCHTQCNTIDSKSRISCKLL